MTHRFPAFGWLVLGTIALGAPVHAAKPAPVKPVAPVVTAPAPDWGLIKQIGEAQRSLGESFQDVKDKVGALEAKLDGAADGANQARDALRDDVKQMRDEVKGLYVEISGVKQQIDDLKTHTDAVDSNVSAFRTFSGFFIAAMLLLLVLNLTLVIRR